MPEGAEVQELDDTVDPKKAERARDFAAKLMAALKLKSVVVPDRPDGTSIEEKISQAAAQLYGMTEEGADLDEFDPELFTFTDRELEKFELSSQEVKLLRAWRHPIDFRDHQKDKKLRDKKVAALKASIDLKLKTVRGDLADLQDQKAEKGDQDSDHDKLARRGQRVLKRAAKVAEKLCADGDYSKAQAVLNGLLYLETLEKLALSENQAADAPKGEILGNEDQDLEQAVASRKSTEELADEADANRLDSLAREVVDTTRHMRDMRITASKMRKKYASRYKDKKNKPYEALAKFNDTMPNYVHLPKLDEAKDHFEEDVDKILAWQKKAVKEVAAGEKLLAAFFKECAEFHEKKLAKYLAISDHEIKQEGADATGHGELQTRRSIPLIRRGLTGLPQEVLRPLAANLEVMQLIAGSEELGRADLELLETFEQEMAAELKVLEDNVDDYIEYEKCAQRWQTQLDKGVLKYTATGKQFYKDQFDGANEKVKDPKNLPDCLKTLKSQEKKLEAQVESAEYYRTLYKDFEKRFNSARKDLTKAYVNQFKATLKAFSDKLDTGNDNNMAEGLKIDAAMLKRLKSAADRKDYVGSFEGKFAKLWGTIEIGDNTTYEFNGEPALKKLIAEIGRETRLLKQAEDAFKGLKGKKAPSALIAGIKGHGSTAFKDALSDMDTSGDKNEKTAEAKARYKEARDRFDNLISAEKKHLKGAARDSFESNETLLKALKSRAKSAASVEDWDELRDEALRLMDEAREFADANVTLDLKDKPPAEKFEMILNRLIDSLSPYFKGMDEFYGKHVKSVAAKARDSDADETAQNVVALIEKNEKAIKSVAEQVGLKMDLSAECFKLITAAKDADMPELIALREQAFAMIRRNRRFLDESKIGGLYKTNPFDGGRPVRRFLYFLEKTEADLLAEVKQS
ncbi:hypothetical protein [Ruegeria lacuscaerulensis]|uniref:hypothetical protein n=1 Tax=Ruegeria lacuscaerulensis TaxID=55218 RepID=UPI00147A4BBD|nr:hypothetical protein [Ruegeria lacuscaerulensis]